MSNIDSQKYPVAYHLIEENHLQEKTDYIQWIRNHSREEVAMKLAEMHQMCKAGLSNSITLRKRSKNASNYYYDAVSPHVHVFARMQAASELGMSQEGVSKLFAHKDIFGKRCVQTKMDDPAFK